MDFHWGNYTFNLEGGSTIFLSELLEILQKGHEKGSLDAENGEKDENAENEGNDESVVPSVEEPNEDGTSSGSGSAGVSQSSGVFWIGTLPYGTYYLEEVTAPSGYTDGKWFWLIVDESGVYMSEQQNDRTTAESGAATKNDEIKAAKLAASSTTP